MAHQRCLTRHQSLVCDRGALEEMETAVNMKTAMKIKTAVEKETAVETETAATSKTAREMETALRWVAALVIGSLALRFLFVFLFGSFLSH